MAGSNNIHIKYPFFKIFSKPPILTYRKLATANYFFSNTDECWGSFKTIFNIVAVYTGNS